MLRYYKKTSLSLILCFVVLITTACSSTEKATSTKTAGKLITNDNVPDVGFLLDTLEEERWYKDGHRLCE